MGIDINSTYHISKTDIESIFKRDKMKPSNITTEELLANRNEQNRKQEKFDLANNYWGGLYSSPSSSEIIQEGMSAVSPVVISEDYTFTDPQFIDNFVTKKSFYEDMAKKYYSGDELKQRLDQLNQVSDEAINKLSEAFAKGIGNFMNGDLGWLYDQNTFTAENSGNEKKFDVKAFKNHIIDVVKSQMKEFKKIKEQNTKEWDKVLDNYGSGLKDFSNKLNSFSNSNSANTSGKIENMSYRDIKAVGSVIHALGGGIYTNSAETLGAYLGQMKLKGDIKLQTTNMSSEVKEALSNAISQNIARKIAHFSIYTDSIGPAYFGSADKVIATFNSFSKLSNTNLVQFRKEYINSLNNLLNSLSERDPAYENESPYKNKVRYANSIVEQQVNDWNSFIDNLAVDDNFKKQSYIAGFNGNIIDDKI